MMFRRFYPRFLSREPSPAGWAERPGPPQSVLILSRSGPRNQANCGDELRSGASAVQCLAAPRALTILLSGLSPQAWRAERRHPKSRAGSSSTARTSASSASKVMPISRNGSVKSQTTGKRISASRAKGQQSTNRMHQPTKRIRAFTSISFHHVASRQRHAVIMSFWLGKLAIPLRKLPYKSVGGWSGWGVSSEGAD